MKKFQLHLWHPIIGIIILNIINALADNLIYFTTAWFIIQDLLPIAGSICYLLLIYIIIRNLIQAVKGLITRRSSGKVEELERQREIERKEIDMVRKSNEILLHLIQDEHREEDR